MKYLILASAVLLIMASCSKKSSSPSSASTSVTFEANGQNIVVQDITIDTNYDYASAVPDIDVNGTILLPGVVDSLRFQLYFEAGTNNFAYSAQSMHGSYTDTSNANCGLSFESLDNSFNAYDFDYSNPNFKATLNNNGSSISGTFQGLIFVATQNYPAGDTVAVTNGKFSATLP